MPARRDVDVKPYAEHDPSIGYRYRPGASMTLPRPDGDHYHIRVNTQGIRSNREFAPEVPPGKKRLVVVGDSVAAGQYCTNEERFTERLEASCDNLEVMNLALEGSGTDQQLLLFQRMAERFDLDMLMLCPYVENIRRNLFDYRVATEASTGRCVLTPKPRFELRDNRLVLRNVPVPDKRPLLDETDARARMRSDAATPVGRLKGLASRSLDALGLKRWVYGAVRHEPFPEYRDPNSRPWRLMEAIIQAFVNVLDGRPLVIVPQVYHAYLEHNMADNYLRRFRSLERPGRVWAIDILPYLRRLDPQARRDCYWSDDCHLTPLGHRVAADALRRELQAIGLILGPAGSRPEHGPSAVGEAVLT